MFMVLLRHYSTVSLFTPWVGEYAKHVKKLNLYSNVIFWSLDMVDFGEQKSHIIQIYIMIY